MKAIIIDNIIGEMAVQQLCDHLEAREWNTLIKRYTPGKYDDIIEAILPSEDVGVLVVLDVALTEEEEQSIETVIDSDQLEQFSGFELLRRIKRISPDTVVCMFSKNFDGAVGTTARALGADGAVSKRNVEEAAKRVDEIARRRLFCNLEFHEAIRSCLPIDTKDDCKHIMRAFHGFFLRTTPAHRFGNLCESLKPFVIRLMPDSAKGLMDNLWRRLEDTHALLSLVDKGARDHVKHTGNVFWIGYYCLQKVGHFRDINNNEGFSPEAFAKEAVMSYDQQLLMGWIIASLFHDWAYADQKTGEVRKLMERIYPKVKINFTSLTKEKIRSAFEPLKTFVTGIQGGGSDIKIALDWMVDNWGKPLSLDYDGSKKKNVADHGILAVAHLLKEVDQNVSEDYNPIFYQAVLAIALHNLSDWGRCWSKHGMPKDIDVPFSRYPLCGLLAFSDNVHTWEREHENPLAAFDTPELKDLVMAYVRAGEVVHFSIESPLESDSQYTLNIITRYSVTHGVQNIPACRELHNAIEKWKSQGCLKNVMKIFSLKDKFRVKLRYQIPFEDDIEIDSED